MAYRPPGARANESASTANPFPMSRKVATTEEGGWKTVGRSGTSAASSSASNAKWGQSALKKTPPPPPTFEEQFPTLGSATAPVQPQKSVVLSGPTFAERMKQKLAEEEAVRLKKEAEEARRAEEERSANLDLSGVPILALRSLRTSQIAQKFRNTMDPAYDYGEYPEEEAYTDYAEDGYEYEADYTEEEYVRMH